MEELEVQQGPERSHSKEQRRPPVVERMLRDFDLEEEENSVGTVVPQEFHLEGKEELQEASSLEGGNLEVKKIQEDYKTLV